MTIELVYKSPIWLPIGGVNPNNGRVTVCVQFDGFSIAVFGYSEPYNSVVSMTIPMRMNTLELSMNYRESVCIGDIIRMDGCLWIVDASRKDRFTLKLVDYHRASFPKKQYTNPALFSLWRDSVYLPLTMRNETVDIDRTVLLNLI